MADITIQQIRQKYPQYQDMNDQQLADALHTKFYSDMPKDQFYQKIGFQQAPVGTTAKVLSAISEPLSHVRMFGMVPLAKKETPQQMQDVLSNKVPAALMGAIQEVPGIQQLMGNEPLDNPDQSGNGSSISGLVNAEAQQMQKQNPDAYKTGGTLGNIALGMVGGGPAEGLGKIAAEKLGLSGIKALMLRGATGGSGALAFPNPATGQNRFENAATGFVGGAALAPIGVLGSKSLTGLRNLGNEGMNYLKGFTPAGRQAELGDKLLQLSGGKIPSIQLPPLEGMQQSLGQATNEPGILALEHGAFKTAPGAAAYGQIKNVNNQAIMDAAQKIAPNVNPDELSNLSTSLADSLSNAKAATDAHEESLWQSVDPNNELHFPKSRLISTVDSVKKQLGPVRSSVIPTEVTQMIDQLPNNIPLMFYKDLRGYVGALIPKYSAANDINVAGALKFLYKGLSDDMKTLPVFDEAAKFMPKPQAQAISDRFDAAEKFSKQKQDIFGTNPLGGIFRHDSTGAASVEPVAVGQKLLNPAKPSGIEQANKAFEVGNVPEGPQNVQSTLVSKLLNDASTGQLDAQGNRMVSGVRLAKALRVNKPLIKKAIPNKTAQTLLQKIGKAAEMNDRIQSVTATGNSTTPLDLSTHRLIDELMGRFVQPTPMESGLIGGLAGDAISQGGKGMMGGYVAGRLGGGVLRRAGNRSAEKMQQLIYDAITNPKQGMDLMKAANQRNLNKLSPVFKKYWSPNPLIYGTGTAVDNMPQGGK